MLHPVLLRIPRPALYLAPLCLLLLSQWVASTWTALFTPAVAASLTAAAIAATSGLLELVSAGLGWGMLALGCLGLSACLDLHRAKAKASALPPGLQAIIGMRLNARARLLAKTGRIGENLALAIGVLSMLAALLLTALAPHEHAVQLLRTLEVNIPLLLGILVSLVFSVKSDGLPRAMPRPD